MCVLIAIPKKVGDIWGKSRMCRCNDLSFQEQLGHDQRFMGMREGEGATAMECLEDWGTGLIPQVNVAEFDESNIAPPNIYI